MTECRQNRFQSSERGLSLVVGILLLCAWFAGAAVIEESFEQDPSGSGWQVFGESSLFQWNEVEERLDVTWDSSQTNSYFHLPLGTVLSQSDNFSIAFDLELSDITIGTTEGKPFTFQIAVGLIGLEDAMRPEFFRASGIHPISGGRNAVEFDYFPDSGFGATFAPTVISTNNRIKFSDNHPLEMTLNDRFRITMTYTSEDRMLRTQVVRNGVPFGLSPDATIKDLQLIGFPDFAVDTVAVMSYSDGGQTLAFAGSVLAHGFVDDLRVVLPAGPIERVEGRIEEGNWVVEFPSLEGWRYRLQRTENFVDWESVAESAGTGNVLRLSDPGLREGGAYYRVEAEESE